ncbi:pyrroline-5-carboxylate reductase [Gorillibacterium sp. sgz5001074]|uniref:pyrroline-5-carboxylate reductase n=1 Tax=Gorillibacterium sp. sgz5001074 TaxID=3446695 RepID=UPI003F66FF2C
MPTNGPSIAFIGAGSMAEAIIRGLIQQNIAEPGRIYAMNRSNREQMESLRNRYGIHCAFEPDDKEAFIRKADIVVVAMKPKDVRQAFSEFSGFLRPDQLLISVVAGLSLDTIAMLVPEGMPAVRTMPNTSSTIGMGATGLCFTSNVSPELRKTAVSLFGAVGEVIVVPESQMNMVNGLSGSGPAYVYYFMEAMIAAGVEGGMDEELARQLTVQTVLGAAAMVKTTQEAPSELRRKVTSPNGTTQAAIETFDRLGFSDAIGAGVKRCVERAAEIGAQISKDVQG